MSSGMSADTRNYLANSLNVGVDSDLWDQALPSDIFVIHRAGLDFGHPTIRHIIQAGYEGLLPPLQEHQIATTLASQDLERVEKLMGNIGSGFQAIEDRISRLKITDDNPATNQELRNAVDALRDQTDAYHHANNGFEILSAQCNAAIDFYSKCRKVLDHFEPLLKIAGSLQRLETYGADYKKHRRAVMELTVCMKCLDALWTSLRTTYKAMKEDRDAWFAMRDYKFPFGEYAQFEQ